MPSEENSVRKRKPTDNEDAHRNGAIKSKPKASNRNLQISFLCLVICVLLIIFVFGFYTDTIHPLIDGIAISLGYKTPVYVVILDAGSTGSRVIGFEFHKGYSDGRLFLDKELFIESKPGLSAFHDRPKEGAQTIEALLGKAKEFVPKEYWPNTPLVLKATAGLRLLPDHEADNLLNEVRDVFFHSGFLVKQDAVEILDGVDEGIYSWFTINFLLNRLGKSKTVAALDLGGGSTQVAFAPHDIHQTPLLMKYMHEVSTLKSKIDVFTNSYLHLGLQAVRHAVMTHNQANASDLHSECINPIVKNKPFKYGKTIHNVSGKENLKSTKENPVVDFEACLGLIKQITLPLVSPKPTTLNHHQIAAFSYFFERAIETGLIDPFEGGEITVGVIFEKAKEVCATANTDQPFMCLDLSYISVLLKDGYDLKPKTTIKLYKKIDGHEISWALGCAYNLLADMSRNKKHAQTAINA